MALMCISEGVVERAVIALEHLLNPSKCRGVAAVLEAMGNHKPDMVKVCMMDDAMELVRQAVAILKQRLPETETRQAYGTIQTIMSGLQLQGHSKAAITAMTNLGRDALDTGLPMWMDAITNNGGFFKALPSGP